VKSEVKMTPGKYVGSYGEEQRKAAQKAASNPHKTLLVTEKMATGALSMCDFSLWFRVALCTTTTLI
jgi:hypothetical protein